MNHEDEEKKSEETVPLPSTDMKLPENIVNIDNKKADDKSETNLSSEDDKQQFEIVDGDDIAPAKEEDVSDQLVIERNEKQIQTEHQYEENQIYPKKVRYNQTNKDTLQNQTKDLAKQLKNRTQTKLNQLKRNLPTKEELNRRFLNNNNNNNNNSSSNQMRRPTPTYPSISNRQNVSVAIADPASQYGNVDEEQMVPMMVDEENGKKSTVVTLHSTPTTPGATNPPNWKNSRGPEMLKKGFDQVKQHMPVALKSVDRQGPEPSPTDMQAYSLKKTLQVFILLVIVVMLNGMQLRFVLQCDSAEFPFYNTEVGLLVVSIISCIALAILLVYMASININDIFKQRKLDFLNYVVLGCLLFLMIFNVFIVAFEYNDQMLRYCKPK
ncbi:hypothetical protein SNEBB_007491 [Seison nebaliae]|nr:hypothetical protein SNEBB_007491 [Seison nebaliae]